MAKIKIGDTQLNFELPGVDGLKHSIKNIQKIKVIIFSCNHCPYAQAWEDRIVNLQSEFSRLDMALVIKIGRLMDSGVVEIDNRLPV